MKDEAEKESEPEFRSFILPRPSSDVKEYFAKSGASKWWDKGELYLNKCDLYILNVVAKKEPKIMLDLGAGKGRLTVPFGLKGLHVVACDISTEMLKFAMKRIKNNEIDENVDVVVGDVENQPFRREVFDVVLCLGTLEHVPCIKARARADNLFCRIFLVHTSNVFKEKSCLAINFSKRIDKST